jgi:hypothetical protein
MTMMTGIQMLTASDKTPKARPEQALKRLLELLSEASRCECTESTLCKRLTHPVHQHPKLMVQNLRVSP